MSAVDGTKIIIKPQGCSRTEYILCLWLSLLKLWRKTITEYTIKVTFSIEALDNWKQRHCDIYVDLTAIYQDNITKEA